MPSSYVIPAEAGIQGFRTGGSPTRVARHAVEQLK